MLICLKAIIPCGSRRAAYAPAKNIGRHKQKAYEHLFKKLKAEKKSLAGYR